MKDRTATVAALKGAVARFIRAREWEQFHSPKNLSMAVSIEAAELMELFQWMEVEEARRKAASPRLRKRIEEEIADIAIYTLSLCHALGLDLSSCIEKKIVRNEKKYPVEKCRGRY
ncbi:MAG: nucleotide pyrophosphohydrolase [Candidatus Aureabacteria bacterium]|jgi:dCTP diphosphatase|nr:nucleotide pyrophosphohydrolase [Candidatus Auribacterota bacterium]NLW95044.1 nucleotide pyrophosphohydrolase [Chlamydiota bacterium]HOE26366.1 nucleotide pyrophosphohydrolase [bacterium]HQM53133.1 nucleotide pyrophosphohydrolase [bacterium]